MTFEFKPLGIETTPDGLVASGAVLDRETIAPTIPPSEWYACNPEYDVAYPIQFEAEGRVHGYASAWGLTHIGYLGRDVETPRSKTKYSKFCTGRVLVDNGSTVHTGRLTINTVHPKMRGAAWNEVQAFYDHSGAAVADVTVFEDDKGIFLAGSVRPSATPEQLRIARGSDWSPDWRKFNGNLEMVALLAVNLSGFIVDGLVASGGLELDPKGICIPGEQYCEFSLNGDIELLIGNTFAEKPAQQSDFEARLRKLEAFATRTQLRETLEALASK